MPSSNIRTLELLKELRQRERFNRINSYDPYPYQKKFHKTGAEANQRLLMAGTDEGRGVNRQAVERALARQAQQSGPRGQIGRNGGGFDPQGGRTGSSGMGDWT